MSQRESGYECKALDQLRPGLLRRLMAVRALVILRRGLASQLVVREHGRRASAMDED
jgi:hypothetical protein